MPRTLYCGDVVLAGPDLVRVEKGAVLVEDGRIAAVGREADFGSFEGGDTVRRKALMPGLVDCHNHMALDADMHNWQARVPDPEAEHVLRAIRTLRDDLRSGVTWARYMGDKYFIDVACRRALADGRLEGPRALVATRGLNTSHSGGLIGSPVDGVEARRKFVRENIRAGADFIKMYITATVSYDNMVCYPTREEMEVVVDEAHNAGLPVAAHCIGGHGFDLCLELGVDTIEHGYYITPRQIEKLVKSGLWLDITVTPILSDYYAERSAPGTAQGLIDAREPLARSMREVVKSGAKFAIGSDGLHGAFAGDVEYLAGFGAGAIDALRAATIQGARMIGVDGEAGSLEAGKRADIVGLEADPTEDVRALRRVSLVVQGGKRKVDS